MSTAHGFSINSSTLISPAKLHSLQQVGEDPFFNKGKLSIGPKKWTNQTNRKMCIQKKDKQIYLQQNGQTGKLQRRNLT